MKAPTLPSANRLAALVWLPAALAAIALAVVAWRAAPASDPPTPARILRLEDRPAPLPAHAAAPASVDLNRASREELEALPGIGGDRAARIIESRSGAPFQATADLVRRGLVPRWLHDRLEPRIGVACVGAACAGADHAARR